MYFHLVVHSLVVLTCALAGDGPHNPGVLGQRSNPRSHRQGRGVHTFFLSSCCPGNTHLFPQQRGSTDPPLQRHRGPRWWVRFCPFLVSDFYAFPSLPVGLCGCRRRPGLSRRLPWVHQHGSRLPPHPGATSRFPPDGAPLSSEAGPYGQLTANHPVILDPRTPAPTCLRSSRAVVRNAAPVPGGAREDVAP